MYMAYIYVIMDSMYDSVADTATVYDVAGRSPWPVIAMILQASWVCGRVGSISSSRLRVLIAHAERGW